MFKKILLLSLLISTQVNADKSDVAKILESFFGKINPDYIQETPFQGVYEVVLGQTLDSILVSENGRYFIQGKVIDLTTGRQMQSAASHKLKRLKQALLDNVSDQDKIIFKAKNEKYAVNVFTDVDCPFCRKLHAEMPEMNRMGITVKYLASPLASLHPLAMEKMEKIWCATDKIQAMDAYKKYKTVADSKACDNPVAAQLAIAQKLGVNGTPAVFLPDGTHIPGYLPAKNLLKKLEAIQRQP